MHWVFLVILLLVAAYWLAAFAGAAHVGAATSLRREGFEDRFDPVPPPPPTDAAEALGARPGVLPGADRPAAPELSNRLDPTASGDVARRGGPPPVPAERDRADTVAVVAGFLRVFPRDPTAEEVQGAKDRLRGADITAEAVELMLLRARRDELEGRGGADVRAAELLAAVDAAEADLTRAVKEFKLALRTGISAKTDVAGSSGAPLPPALPPPAPGAPSAPSAPSAPAAPPAQTTTASIPSNAAAPTDSTAPTGAGAGAGAGIESFYAPW